VGFCAGGNAASFLRAGWSVGEPQETWSLGRESQLVLPAPRLPWTYVMVLKMRPLVGGPVTSQRLLVTVNGVLVATFNVDRRTVRTCVVPWDAIADRDTLDIRFQTPDAARPVDIGANNDTRLLGIAFVSLNLYPDSHEAAQGDAFLSGHEPVAVDVGAVTAVDRLPLRDLMVKFESLGQNCEFGLVQRQCQAEPLGLLRFSSTPLPQLLDALESRFEGMGTAATTTVSVSPNGREYMVQDSRFGFVYHAWVNTGEMAVEDVMRREVRRVPFLVRKLLEDLEGGEKIFVFKGMGAVPAEEVFPLAMAIRRYGPNTLLFVTLADAEHRGGTVEARSPGFMIGYLDRFAPGDNAHDFLLSQWVKLCRDAYRLRLAAGARAA
jgi:hypothetical protein